MLQLWLLPKTVLGVMCVVCSPIEVELSLVLQLWLLLETVLGVMCVVCSPTEVELSLVLQLWLLLETVLGVMCVVWSVFARSRLALVRSSPCSVIVSRAPTRRSSFFDVRLVQLDHETEIGVGVGRWGTCSTG